ncbi:MAG: ABC transporter substrate-binding protein [Trueperaceae bacterium]|nr:ABC transporter substrate-binding protein [Trueperaceae bacterium]
MVKRIVVSLLVTAFMVSAAWSQEAGPPPGFDSWDAVLEEARGQTLNWNLWGGSNEINRFLDEVYGQVLRDEFGVRLNRVPLADTADAVNQVLSEVAAGRGTEGGSVDLIWINGENFKTLKQADLLYGPFAQNVPNTIYVDWDNPTVTNDLGLQTDHYEIPWASFPFQWIYDTMRIDEEDLPRSYAELAAWMRENPGRFTYIAPGPGAFQGTRVVKQLMLEMCGGFDAFGEVFSQELYDECAPRVWDELNSWKPYMWRNGETYPADENELDSLFANGEIDFTLTQRGGGATSGIAAGDIPPTSSAFLFDENMIGGYSYLAIPINASNKAAALVMANLLVRPDMQARQLLPDTIGFALGIDVARVTDPADRALIDEATATAMASGAADPADFGAIVPDIHNEYHGRVESDWERCVLRNACN